MLNLLRAAGVIVLAVASGASAAEPFTPAQENRIRELAIGALLERRGILREVIRRLEEKEAAEAEARTGRLRGDA